MRVTSLQLQNFRSFESMEPILLDQINVLVGPNNAGKSSLLRALHLLQVGCGNMYSEVRVGATAAQVTIGLREVHGVVAWNPPGNVDLGTATINIHSSDRISGSISIFFREPNVGLSQLQNMEPNHFIVPYLSKRKTAAYQEDVRNENALRVSNDMSFLPAKLSRLANPGFPEHDRYRNTCMAILGFLVTTIPSTAGQRAGVYLPDRQTIPIDQMGEGVPNIVTLLADLALSKGKLFLIEELENDLHPKALKALLDLIVESSQSNQFVISTHSNIVVRHLASAPNSKLYNINAEAGRMPAVATIREVEPTVEARLTVLRDLGYAFSDFDLWDGWLILEESSAERIIRDYLIPWFAPKLSRVRTVATGGVDQVEPTFDDFHRLILFTHLEEAYRNAAWVRVDGDKPGAEIIKKLQDRYPSWNADRFKCFDNAQFEHYYPSEFSEQINIALATVDKQDRRNAKRQLLDDVRAWLDADELRGREALGMSALEVISDLKAIEQQLIK